MLPTFYDVGPVRVSPNVVLAPMEGVTDLTFRRLIRQIGGVGLTCTEFIASGGLKADGGKMYEMAQTDPDERPVSIQLYGKDPAQMAEAARIVQGLGATICDVNMGCPSKKVCSNSGGSALMREPALARDIVRAVVAAVDIPVTVKMRSGFDAGLRNAPELAWICQEEGAQAVAIHWRTREDRYGGQRRVDKIAEAKARLRVPVLANGDIVDVASAEAMFRETGCDGVLVGRGAIRNPWLLKQISQWLAGEPPVVVDAAERRRVMLAYLAGIRAMFRSDHGALGRYKMLAGYYTRQLPQGRVLKQLILHSHAVPEAIEHTEAYFARLVRHEGGEADAFEGYAAPEYVRAPKARGAGRVAAVPG
ncbi:MAG: tRNA dihydrouridine synthase DusB [Alphaproteobacteria bacterium]|nr:tRNA dihydrouridine synthase DusB [Alphaproteobacteria bacterium]